MAYEDFTTYTEVDPGTKITVATNKVSWVGLMDLSVSYVYKDYGANYFTGNFEHLFTPHITGSTANGYVMMYTIGAQYGDYGSLTDALSFYHYAPAGTFSWRIRDFGTTNSDSYNSVVDNDYYVTVDRISTTFRARIYSDSARTTLLDTLSITGSSNAFRYLQAVASENGGGGADNTTGYTENLDLQIADPFYPNDFTGKRLLLSAPTKK